MQDVISPCFIRQFGLKMEKIGYSYSCAGGRILLVHQWGDLISISIEHHKVRKMSKDLRQLVAEKFPAGIDNLHNLVGATKNRVTKLLKENEENWKLMDAEEVAAWAAVLEIDRSELIMVYGCGFDRMTPNQANQLIR